ncbi:MAG: UDP-N-acetylmuramate--L-alanine ligase [Candidatus Omnitrophica bacterium]|nr:UDP-N-acetylmuramate--L-alanine ligase [Candidatus Omnitrophota bacterium]MDD5592305.1 UDP-N-acetylmuramate--L-alanine ligase [Candidatus Omnitrophota bacterium]
MKNSHSPHHKHYHLIGIAGIGMSGIARLLLRRGFGVSGSDLKETKITQELKNLGAQVFIGHDPANIKGADIIIYSSAICRGNPEMQEAQKQRIPLIKRAEALSGLMEDEVVVTVTGSHGKTTTASLVSYLLLQAGFSPTIAVGGILRNIDTNACLGDGKFFVAEADESDGSFLYYRPKYSIITNIDYEHLDYYGEFKNTLAAFKKFLTNTRADGCVFACSDDMNLREMIKDYKNRYLLFGLKDGAEIYPKAIEIKELSSQFDCFYQDKFLDRFYLALGGEHNISNALSVIALGLELGIDLKVIKDTLAGYKGAKRRLEVKFSDKGYLLVDDYAHHPTEIKATLAALKNLKSNRLIAIFQPHRYTRTKLLSGEFGKSFDLADYIIVTDIYPAGEEPQAGIDGRLIYDKIKERSPQKQIHFLPKEEIAAHVLENIRPHDLLVTLGAGDIVKTCDELAQMLQRKD